MEEGKQTITFTTEETNKILLALAERPYKEVSDLIQKIRSNWFEQNPKEETK